MTTARTRLQIMPRQAQVGDLIQHLNDDLTIGYTAITKVEAIRVGRTTRYAIHTDDDRVIYRAANASLAVAR